MNNLAEKLERIYTRNTMAFQRRNNYVGDCYRNLSSISKLFSLYIKYNKNILTKDQIIQKIGSGPSTYSQHTRILIYLDLVKLGNKNTLILTNEGEQLKFFYENKYKIDYNNSLDLAKKIDDMYTNSNLPLEIKLFIINKIKNTKIEDLNLLTNDIILWGLFYLKNNGKIEFTNSNFEGLNKFESDLFNLRETTLKWYNSYLINLDMVSDNELTSMGLYFFKEFIKYNEKDSINHEIGLSLDYNYLVFGSPGTGKSYLLEEKRKKYFDENHFERTTFYDGYTYGQFVGSYKPKVKINKNIATGTEVEKSKDEKEIITYKYIPGPFMKMLVKALKNSNEKYLILIEELNRAKADSVFGDVFQLLDRSKYGESKYRIAISEDQEAYLKEQGLGDIEKLYIPNNLYIWATMNSADQGVYPLDTAFKRRWSYEYLTLNENEKYFGSINGVNKYENYKINIGDEKRIEWNKFRKKINEIVSEGNASEDRMLAPFFLVPEDFKEIDGKEIFILNDEVHKFKLLSYIFDDLLMYDKKSKSKIFKSEIKSFSKLIETFNENINGVYNDDFIKTIVDTEQPEKTEEAE